jgi:ABC-2 type transport system permease protein
MRAEDKKMQHLLRKEFKEDWRTARYIVLGALFLVMGFGSPLLAKYTPELMRLIPDVPAELMAMIPPPTLHDAIGQYTKNNLQFGALIVVLLGMGLVAQEKERGTAAMLLTKPVIRTHVILAKWLALMVGLTVSLALSAAAAAYYTMLLFEPLPLWEFALLNVMMLVFFGLYFTAALFASTLARTQAQAAGGAFGLLAILLLAGSLPRIGDFLPGKLIGWGESAVLGASEPAWMALWVSLILMAVLLAAACWIFEKQEI